MLNNQAAQARFGLVHKKSFGRWSSKFGGTFCLATNVAVELPASYVEGSLFKLSPETGYLNWTLWRFT